MMAYKNVETNDGLVLTGIEPLSNELGRGAYGRVYAVKYCQMICAAKEIHAVLVEEVGEEESRQTIESFLRECRQCSKLRHPNVIQFLGVYYPTRRGSSGAGIRMRLPVMVMEMMSCSLTSFVEKHENIPIHIKHSIVHDVSLGLCYLHYHDPPIVHRDLSPNNVLLTAHHVAKISDLGVARVIKPDSKKTMTKAPGTVDFMPPEALSNQPDYGPPLDIFSFAGIILHTFTQQWPRPIDQVQFDPKTRERKALSEVDRRKQYLDMMTGDAERLKSLVEQCLDSDPKVRPLTKTVSERIRSCKDECRGEFPQECITLHQQIEQLKVENAQLQDTNSQLQATNSQLQTTIQLIRSSKEVVPSVPTLASSKHYIKWTRLADLPVPLYYAHAVVNNSKVYVTGQSPVEGMENQVLMFDIATNHWQQLPQSGHSFGILHVIGGKLAIIGGRLVATRRRTNIVSTFNEERHAWVQHYPNLISARNRPGVGSHLEYVIVAGGTGGNDNDVSIVQSDIEVLNWKEHSQWKKVSTKLPVPMYGFVPTVSDGNLLIVGYSDAEKKRDRSAYKIPVADIVLSDHNRTTTAKWTGLAVASRWGASLIPGSSPPMIIGGEDATNATTANIKVYDNANKSWRNSKLLTSARSYAAVAAISNDSIVVIGGCTNGGSGANWNSSSLKLVELGKAELLV